MNAVGERVSPRGCEGGGCGDQSRKKKSQVIRAVNRTGGEWAAGDAGQRKGREECEECSTSGTLFSSDGGCCCSWTLGSHIFVLSLVV